MKTRLYKSIKDFLENGNGDSHPAIKKIFKYMLMPLSIASIFISRARRRIRSGNYPVFQAKNAGIFVISFGNLTMGGSGKTPFSAATAEYLYGKGLKPCIISRGYKGRIKKNSI